MYLIYSMFRGRKIVDRVPMDFVEEYILVAVAEAVGIVLIPFGISLQIKVQKMKVDREFCLYDEERQEYVKSSEENHVEDSSSREESKSIDKFKGRSKANYIRSVALIQSISQRKKSNV